MVTTIVSTTDTYNMKNTAVTTVTNAKLNKLKLELTQATNIVIIQKNYLKSAVIEVSCGARILAREST